jgi:coenzyme PQQ precursor peptide PqqA
LTENRGLGGKKLCIAAPLEPLTGEKIPLANFSFRITLSTGRSSSGFTLRRAKMAWKAPKIVEVPVGMEINMYACAARK